MGVWMQVAQNGHFELIETIGFFYEKAFDIA
jgi:hypothetical protein